MVGRIALYPNALAAVAGFMMAAPIIAQAPHTILSPLFSSLPDAATQADGATQLERDRPVGWSLAQHRKLDTVLKGLQPGRKGMVNAFVVSVALDSDPVFAREAREAGRVLARRYDAAGRTVVLAGASGPGTPDDLPFGSPVNLAAVLARVAEIMNRDQDVLVLYTTSHGAPFGIVYNDGDQGSGSISPSWLRSTLGELQIKNRLLIISACFSGVFAPVLASESSVVITAARPIVPRSAVCRRMTGPSSATR
jgi:class 3 adenylate cyclase